MKRAGTKTTASRKRGKHITDSECRRLIFKYTPQVTERGQINKIFHLLVTMPSLHKSFALTAIFLAADACAEHAAPDMVAL